MGQGALGRLRGEGTGAGEQRAPHPLQLRQGEPDPGWAELGFFWSRLASPGLLPSTRSEPLKHPPRPVASPPSPPRKASLGSGAAFDIPGGAGLFPARAAPRTAEPSGAPQTGLAGSDQRLTPAPPPGMPVALGLPRHLPLQNSPVLQYLSPA